MGRPALRRRRPRRNGFLMAAVLVLLVGASLVISAFLRRAALARKDVGRAIWQAQAAQLADAGVERAAATLASDAACEGETWRLGPDDLDGRLDAAVAISVGAPSPAADARQVSVSATVSLDGQVLSRRSRTLQLPTTMPGGHDESQTQ